nr:MAG TPA: hypothetical protein [Caudoviricetes sp.]
MIELGSPIKAQAIELFKCFCSIGRTLSSCTNAGGIFCVF